MNLYRRRRNQYLFVILLGVIGVINVLFFFILYRPVRAEYFRLQGSIQKARAPTSNRVGRRLIGWKNSALNSKPRLRIVSGFTRRISFLRKRVGLKSFRSLTR